MIRLSRIMLDARRRRIDMKIHQATEANDNDTLETLRRQRMEVGREVVNIIFQPCVARALDAMRRSK